MYKHTHSHYIGPRCNVLVGKRISQKLLRNIVKFLSIINDILKVAPMEFLKQSSDEVELRGTESRYDTRKLNSYPSKVCINAAPSLQQFLFRFWQCVGVTFRNCHTACCFVCACLLFSRSAEPNMHRNHATAKPAPCCATQGTFGEFGESPLAPPPSPYPSHTLKTISGTYAVPLSPHPIDLGGPPLDGLRRIEKCRQKRNCPVRP